MKFNCAWGMALASLLGFTGCAGSPHDFSWSIHPATSAMVRFSGPGAIAAPTEAMSQRLELPEGGHADFEILIHRKSGQGDYEQSGLKVNWAPIDATADHRTSLDVYQVLDVRSTQHLASATAPAATSPSSQPTVWVPDVCLPLDKTLHLARPQEHRPGDITLLVDVHARRPFEGDKGDDFLYSPRHEKYRLDLTDEQGRDRHFELEVVVLPVILWNLPFHTSVNWNWHIDKYLGRDLSPEERMAYFDFFLDFRFTPANFFARGLNFDDREITHVHQRGGDVFQVFFQGGGGKRALTPQQQQQLEPQLRQWHDQLHRLGIDGDAYALIGDEPKPEAFATIRANAQWLKSVWPDLKIWVATRPQRELLDVVDVWDVIVAASTDRYTNHSYSAESDHLAQEAPNHPQRWWFYSDEPYPPGPNVRLDNNLVDARAIGVLSAARDMDGFEYFWATDWAPNKSLRDTPWPAKAEQWNTGDAGAGILCYPGNDGLPIPSLRLFNLRDGFEDWALLKMAGMKPTESDEALRDPATIARLRDETLRRLERK